MKEKTQTLEAMKKNMKVSKFQEMEQEKISLYDELKRLRNKIEAYEADQ